LLIACDILIRVLFAFLLVDYIFHLVGRLPSQFDNQRKSRHTDKIRNALVQGQIELTECHFARSEKILLQKFTQNENAMLASHGLAHAAQYQGAYNRRDVYLQLVHEIALAAEIAISLTQAELQLSRNQYVQALAL
jgi:HemY protein